MEHNASVVRDELAVRSLLDGDGQAFSALEERARVPVARARHHVLGNASDAENAVQGAGPGQASGSLTVNVAPRPRPGLSAATDPPMASASDLVIVRPRPLPPLSRERDGSAR